MIFSSVSVAFQYISLSVFHSAEFLREEVVVLLTAQFITLFNQTALEVRAATVEIHQPVFPSISHNVTLFYPEFHPNCINLSLTWKDPRSHFERIIKIPLILTANTDMSSAHNQRLCPGCEKWRAPSPMSLKCSGWVVIQHWPGLHNHFNIKTKRRFWCGLNGAFERLKRACFCSNRNLHL